MTRPAVARQADIARVLKAAKSVSPVARMEATFTPDGATHVSVVFLNDVEQPDLKDCFEGVFDGQGDIQKRRNP